MRNPKIVLESPNYFQEVGAVVDCAFALKERRIDIIFRDGGMQITETFGDGVRGEIYHSAAELRAYLCGLEDGFFHAIKVDQALFTESKFTDPAGPITSKKRRHDNRAE